MKRRETIFVEAIRTWRWLKDAIKIVVAFLFVARTRICKDRYQQLVQLIDFQISYDDVQHRWLNEVGCLEDQFFQQRTRHYTEAAL